MSKDVIFADGFIVKKAPEGAPAWIKSTIAIKVDEFIPFLEQNAVKGWVNLDVKSSKEGNKLYASLNTYKREKAGIDHDPLPDGQSPY